VSVVDRGERHASRSEWHGDDTAGEKDDDSGLAAMAPARTMHEARPRRRVPRWQASREGTADWLGSSSRQVGRMSVLTVIVSELWERKRAMRWLQGCAILFVLSFVLFAVPARLEGPVLIPISPGHGLALIDVVALVPLLGGLALLVGGLWQRRERLDAALTRRPWAARIGAFGVGLGLGLLMASVFVFFWWWAIGAGLLTVMLLAAAVVASGSERAGAGWRSGRTAAPPAEGGRRPPAGRP
jgi:hypothetical protein